MMKNIYKFRELTETEYQHFALNHAYASFQQTPQMMAVQKMNGKRICYLGVESNQKIVAACAFTITRVMRFYDYLYANRGILMDYNDGELLHFYISELKKYGKRNHVLYCRIDPNVTLTQRDINGDRVEGGFDHHDVIERMKKNGCQYCGETIGFDPRSQMRFMFVLSLNEKTPAVLLKEMDSQTRWSINKAQKLGVQVRELNADEMPLFKNIMDHTSERKGFSDRDLAFYENMKKGFQSDFKCMVAEIQPKQLKDQLNQEIASLTEEKRQLLEKETLTRKQKSRLNEIEECIQVANRRLEEANRDFEGDEPQILAGASFVTSENEIVYFTAGAYAKYKHYNGPYAIHWAMLQWALENGIERYNFYGISGDFSKEAVDFGVYEFKKGFNGVVEEYVGDFIVEMNPVFKLYNKIKKIV